MIRSWNHLVGVCLAGRYRLEEWLGTEEPAAWFLTASRSGERAAIQLVPEEAARPGQLEAWSAVRLLSHSNLLPMFDCGRAETGNGAVLYAVFEYPEDHLASALEEGRLDEASARQTLAACLEALQYIHAQGMVHGAVDGNHIVAVGERIKLASDTLRPASAGWTPEDDIRGLYSLLGIPYPAAEDSVVPITAPPREPAPLAAKGKFAPNWAFLAAAGTLAAVILAFALRPSTATRATAPKPAPASQPSTPAHAVPPAGPVAVPAASSQPEGRMAWRVVAYTYNHYQDAQKRADRLNQRWPSLRASVFAPKGKNRPPYFVVLGGRMSHEEAIHLLRLARAKGLPRDTFIRNYSD
jgi:hypothetical protein